MTVIWFALLVLWLVIILFDGEHIAAILWWFLLFLWIGLVGHYTIAYRHWTKEMNIRKQERKARLQQLSEGKSGGTKTRY